MDDKNQEMQNYEAELEIKKAEEEIEKADKSIIHRMELLTACLAVLIVIIAIMIVAFINITLDHGKQAEETSLTIIEKNTEIKQLLSALEAKDNSIDSLENKVESLTAMLQDENEMYKEQKEINEKLYNDNKALLEETNEFDSKLQEVKDRLEVYEKFDYAMFNSEGKRNDLNYDYVKELEELVKYKPVADLDFYLSWIMIESEGNATAKNPNSTAKGFPQFLDSTSKSVYNTYLADKYEIEWYPEIVTDHPDIALDMMVEYVNYLYIECSRDIPAVIDCYRGLHDGPYIRQFEKYLEKSGKTIMIINNNTEKRYKELQTAVG